MAIDAVGGIHLDVNINMPPPAGPDGPPGGPPSPDDGPDLQIPLQESNETLGDMKDIFSDLFSFIKVTARQDKASANTMEGALEAITENTLVSKQYASGEKGYSGGKGKRRDKIEEYFMKKMVTADFFTKAGQWLKGIAKATMNFIVDIIKFLMVMALFGPEFLDAIISFVLNFVIMLVNMFVAAIPSVVAAIAKFLPIIINALVRVILMLIPILMDAIPKLIIVLADAIVQIVQGIATILPVLIPALIKVFVTIVQALVKMLPIVLKAILDMIPILIESLVAVIPELLMAIVGLIPVLLNAIVTAIPIIIKALVKAIPILIKAFIGAIKTIIDALITSVPMIITALVEAIPMILDALIEAIPMIIEALIEAIPLILESVLNILVVLIPMFIKLWLTIWKKLLQALIKIFPLLLKAWITIWDKIITIFNDVVARIKKMFSFETIKSAVENAFTSAGNLLNNIILKSKEYFFDIMDKIKNFINGLITRIVYNLQAMNPFASERTKALAAASNKIDASKIGQIGALTASMSETDREAFLLKAGGEMVGREGFSSATEGQQAVKLAGLSNSQLEQAVKELRQIREQSGDRPIRLSEIPTMR